MSRNRGRVLVAGEALVDVIPEGAGEEGPGGVALRGRAGGSPANVAVGLARLGVPVAFAGRVSVRGFGPMLRQHLESEGVDLGPSLHAEEPATLAVVSLDTEGRATYEFYGPDTADWQWRPDELPAVASVAGGAVHTGSLAAALPPGGAVLAAWLGEVRAGGDTLVSYDPNVRPTLLGGAERWASAIAPFLAAANLVKVSEEDLEFLQPGVRPGTAAQAWLRPGPEAPGADLVVVTLGAAGALVLRPGEGPREVPAPRVEVADTVGAGDAFTAGLLAGLSAAGALTPAGLAAAPDDVVVAAVDRANTVAALTCSRPGADPPRASELGGAPAGAG